MAILQVFGRRPVSSSPPRHRRLFLKQSCGPYVESHYIERLNKKNILGPEMLDDLVQTTMLLH